MKSGLLDCCTGFPWKNLTTTKINRWNICFYRKRLWSSSITSIIGKPGTKAPRMIGHVSLCQMWHRALIYGASLSPSCVSRPSVTSELLPWFISHVLTRIQWMVQKSSETTSLRPTCFSDKEKRLCNDGFPQAIAFFMNWLKRSAYIAGGQQDTPLLS